MLSGSVLAVLACASPIAATYLLLVAIPNTMHSRFRHALWDVRDAVVDDVLDGRLELNKATKQLLTTIHLAIMFAPEHTMRSAVMAVSLLKDREIVPLEKVLSSKAVPAQQRPLLLAHYDKVQRATTEHLLFGSPSGWVASLLALVFGPVRRKEHRRVEKTVKRELSALPSLYPDARPTSSELACAI